MEKIRKDAISQLNRIVGKNYSFERLKKWIEKSKDRPGLLMVCLTALIPNPKKESEKKSRLRKLFLSTYLSKIREMYQVPYKDEPFERWKVKDEKEFIKEMVELKKQDHFPDCSYRDLAELLHKHFLLNSTPEEIFQIIRHLLYNKNELR